MLIIDILREARGADFGKKRAAPMRDRTFLVFEKQENTIVVKNSQDSEGRIPLGFAVTLDLVVPPDQVQAHTLKLINLIRTYFNRPDASFFVTLVLPRALTKLPGYEILGEVAGEPAKKFRDRLRRLQQFRVKDEEGFDEYDDLNEPPWIKEKVRVDAMYRGPENYRATTVVQPQAIDRPTIAPPRAPDASVWGLMRNPQTSAIEFTLPEPWMQFVAQANNYPYKRLLVQPSRLFFRTDKESEADSMINDLRQRYRALSPEAQRQIGQPIPRPFKQPK